MDAKNPNGMPNGFKLNVPLNHEGAFSSAQVIQPTKKLNEIRNESANIKSLDISVPKNSAGQE